MSDHEAHHPAKPPASVSAWSMMVFLTWTITSFLCHHFAKAFLKQTRSSDATVSGKYLEIEFSAAAVFDGALNASVLTAVQIAMCYLYVDVTSSTSGSRSIIITRICHVTATFFTNFSMACMFASSTFAIKLMEPITSAFVQYAMLGTPLSPMAILSLPVIVGGAIVFSGNPLGEANLSFGITAAFASNLVLALRNTALKASKSPQQNSAITLRPFSWVRTSAVCTCCVVCILSWACGYLSSKILAASVACIFSGVFHVVYSFVSTGIVLAHLSVVSHAVANILKRILVVLLLYMTGTRSASPYNFLGLVVCTAGLFLYAWSKMGTAENRDVHKTQSVFKVRPALHLLSPVFVFIGFGLLSITVSTASRSPYQMSSASRQKPFQHLLKVLNGDIKDSGAFTAPQSMAFDSRQRLAPAHTPVGRRTFSQYAHDLPRQGDLLPPLNGSYLSEQSQNIQQFLKKDLFKHPEKSSFLSKQVRSTPEVINEAQRLHFDVLGKALRKYRYAMLLDIAAFENKGDPCITVGETLFLARIKLEVVYYCSAQTCKDNLHKAAKLAQQYSPDELVILNHGGGNIVGYPSQDLTRFIMFKLFKNYKIFVFPQSIYIRDFHEAHFPKCAQQYCCNENLTMVMRDHQSYSYAQQYFKGSTKFLLAPDIVFQLGPVTRTMSPVFDIMWIRRGDSEAPGYSNLRDPPPGVRVHVSDWWDWITPPAPNNLERAHYICTNGFFYLQRGRVVITDRLHGHILSTLMDIPHVLIDNKQHKLSAYHSSWTVGVNNTLITDDPSKALDLALQLLNKYKDSLPPRVPFLHINELGGDHDRFDKLDSSYT